MNYELSMELAPFLSNARTDFPFNTHSVVCSRQSPFYRAAYIHSSFERLKWKTKINK